MVTFTGLGSLPGSDFPSALRMTFDKAPDFPYLPELPARGPWADMLGRGLGLPGGLPAELSAGEWRLSDHPGIDQRRARATLRDDLDLLEETAHDYRGRFKLGITGPWTLAASLGVTHTGRVLADPGARRDLAASLAESVGELLADLHRRLPALELVLQVDEPGLPAVAAGAVPTPGGFFRHGAVDLPEIASGLARITAEPQRRGLEIPTVLHSCAPWSGPGKAWPVTQLLGTVRGAAGFGAIAMDVDMLSTADQDQLSAALDAGHILYLGALPTTGPERPLSVDALRRRVLTIWSRLGAGTPDQLVITPACGLARWRPDQVSAAFGVLARTTEQVGAELAG